MKKRVLIVDDSAMVRQLLSRMLSKAPDLEVVGTAPDPYVARDKIVQLDPDVLTLDVEMPRMDGLTFLGKLMKARPMPVVMVSSLTQAGAETTLAALEMGAVDFVAKPNGALGGKLEELEEELIEKVRAASTARFRVNGHTPQVSRLPVSALPKTTSCVVAIGSSTGGTEALRVLLGMLPASSPAIVITQHMPEHFTRAFAERLNSQCAISVKEAAEGDSVLPGQALLAPGNKHMVLQRSGARYLVQLKDGPKVCNCRPSVDVLFGSVAKYAGANSVGVILTGMGSDGASGIAQMKTAGARTIAQNEDTCVVFGMPKEAIKTGAVDDILPLERIAERVLQAAGERR